MAGVSKEVGASFCLPGDVFESFSKMDINTLCICKRVSEELIDASVFLPDEIVFEILSKVADFRTLCICKHVSKRFYQIAGQVACQVDTISFIAPSSWETDNYEFREDVDSYAVLRRNRYKNFYGTRTGRRYREDVIWYAVLKRNRDKNFYGTRTGRRYIYFDGGLIDSMNKFTRLKSLYIELPFSLFDHLPLLKWKVFIDGNRIKSFVILSPRSIHDSKGSSCRDHKKEDPTSIRGWYCDYLYARTYLEDAFVRYMMLFGLTRECPVLEKITITDSCKMGRVSVSGAKLFEARKSRAAPLKLDEFYHEVSWCRIPSLDLSVSGLVMKRVEVVIFELMSHLPSGYNYDRYIKIDDNEGDFEDKVEAAYSEAVREIFKKHRDKIKRWDV